MPQTFALHSVLEKLHAHAVKEDKPLFMAIRTVERDEIWVEVLSVQRDFLVTMEATPAKDETLVRSICPMATLTPLTSIVSYAVRNLWELAPCGLS